MLYINDAFVLKYAKNNCSIFNYNYKTKKARSIFKKQTTFFFRLEHDKLLQIKAAKK